MPITLTPIAVTDDDGAVQQYHIAEAASESCNLDDARAAGHVVEVTWAELFNSACQRHVLDTLTDAELRTFLCDRCFGLGGES